MTMLDRTMTITTLAVLLTACSGVEPDGVLDDERGDEVDEIIANLEVAGIPDEDIDVRDDDTVVIEGDIVITLEASRELAGEPEPEHDDGEHTFRQYRTNAVVASWVEDICINGSAFTGTRGVALDEAIASFNDQDLSFTMHRYSDTAPAWCDATIQANVVGGTGGSAGFPSGGLPFDEINIGASAVIYGLPRVRHLIMHELGHAVGFRHSDFYNRAISCPSGGAVNEGDAGVGAVHIPNTPTTAVLNGSVMNACYNLNSTGIWTDSDVDGLQMMYGRWFQLKTMFQGAGRCLEGNSPSSWNHGGNAFMDDCGNYSGQRWRMVEQSVGGETYYRFKTMFQGNGMCLEGNDPGAWWNHGGNAYMAPCSGSGGQLWSITEDNGWLELRTMSQGQGRCLEGNDPGWWWKHGGNAFMDGCGNYSGQYWQMVES